MRRSWMSKLFVALASVVLVALTSAGCDSPTAQPTGCVASYPDTGATPGVVCDIGWSCSDDTQHYQILCTETGGNYSCTCTTDTTTATILILVNPFRCPGDGAQGAALGCDWDLQM